MKRIANIAFSVMFSVFILIIGTGISVVKCNHSGNYKFSLTLFSGDDNSINCNTPHGCMEKDFVKFSPDVTHDFQGSYDFHSAAVCVVSETFFVFNDLMRAENRTDCFSQNINPPPKDFCKLFRVFRI